MENIQINGQKIWGPPKDWIGPPPPHGTEVFIKNIPDDVSEDELYNLFSSIHKIYEVRLPVHWNGINKGYAFVRYTKISEADAAIHKLNHYPIRPNRQIKVERSLDNARLFLSSVPNDKTGEELKYDLLTVVENVKTVYVYPALENPTMFRGYAFVEFVCHRDAAIAKRILTPDVLFNLFERKCVAAWANPLPFLNKETLKNINTLFMRNIPNNTKSISIRIAVDSLIAPDSVHKVKRLNDFAFLTFKNHDMAKRAMSKIMDNPFLLGIKAVHVEWAIPRELANSFSAKGVDLGKDDALEQNFDSNLESCQNPVFKLPEVYKNQSKSPIEDNIGKNCLNLYNIENSPFLKITNNRLLQRPPSKLDSFSALNKNKIVTKKTNSKPSFQSSLLQNNVNKPSQFSAFITDQNYSTQEQSLLSEFCYSNSENYYRNMHLANWLQSLALTDQPTPSVSSPILNSPSTSSSTNLSWKWDEGCSQFSFGSGNSAGYDAQACKIKANSKNYDGFAWF